MEQQSSLSSSSSSSSSRATSASWLSRVQIGLQACQTLEALEQQQQGTAGASHPLDFPVPRHVHAAICTHMATVIHPLSGHTKTCKGVIHRQEYLGQQQSSEKDNNNNNNDDNNAVVGPRAYWPRKRLQDTVFGSIALCIVLRPHKKSSSNQSNNEDESLKRHHPVVVWEITDELVTMNMCEWDKCQRLRGRWMDDPIKDIAVSELLAQKDEEEAQGGGSPHVLTYTEVLQDKEHLYAIAPYCRNGDLFGLVEEWCGLHSTRMATDRDEEEEEEEEDANVHNAPPPPPPPRPPLQQGVSDGGGVGGCLPEPMARHVFRQLLQGVHHLQLCGICHRDLSLETVVMDGNGVCKITSFATSLRVPYNSSVSDDDSKKPQQQQQEQSPLFPATASPQKQARLVDATDPRHLTRRLIKPQGTVGKLSYMSPEVYKNSSDMDGFAVDLWSLGVILYTLLCGFLAYDHPNRSDARFMVICVHGQLKEMLQHWGLAAGIVSSSSSGNNNVLSWEAIDLLQNMLREDPRDRLTLAQVMVHPWVIREDVMPPQPPPPTTAATATTTLAANLTGKTFLDVHRSFVVGNNATTTTTTKMTED